MDRERITGDIPDVRQTQEPRHQAWCHISKFAQALKQGTVTLRCLHMRVCWWRGNRIADLKSTPSFCSSSGWLVRQSLRWQGHEGRQRMSLITSEAQRGPFGQCGVHEVLSRNCLELLTYRQKPLQRAYEGMKPLWLS